MVDSGIRNCTRCGTRLARDNHRALCTPCARTHDRAPQLTPAAWRTDKMREALHSKNIGVVLRYWRYHPAHGSRAVPQTELARWLGITQGQLSRIENGRNRVRDLDKLTHYAHALDIPAELLWFEIDNTGTPPFHPTGTLRLRGGAVTAAATTVSGPVLPDSLLATLDEYGLADRLTGPHALVPIVTQQIRFIEQLKHTSRGCLRDRLRIVHARFAEFLGWLHQDSGNPTAALESTTLAGDLARESRDDALLSYIRMRHSNLAADTGDLHTTMDLAREALDTRAVLTPGQRAMALRQLAHGYARLHDPSNCARALDQAWQHAVHAYGYDDHLAGYCTPEYIGMEAADCLVELGRPEQAIAILEPRLPRWQTDNRRDLGRGLALLAVAQARIRQPDRALAVAEHALAITAETRSTRTEQQLYRVSRELFTHNAPDHAAELRLALHNTLL